MYKGIENTLNKPNKQLIRSTVSIPPHSEASLPIFWNGWYVSTFLRACGRHLQFHVGMLITDLIYE